MVKKCIGKIQEQGKKYTNYSNEWNVMQQLIDIIAVAGEDTAKLVMQDLDVNEMNVSALVKKITVKRIANPEEVMKKICDFYKIPCPEQLPPEQWRMQGNNSNAFSSGEMQLNAQQQTEKPAEQERKHKHVSLFDVL